MLPNLSDCLQWFSTGGSIGDFKSAEGAVASAASSLNDQQLNLPRQQAHLLLTFCHHSPKGEVRCGLMRPLIAFLHMMHSLI